MKENLIHFLISTLRSYKTGPAINKPTSISSDNHMVNRPDDGTLRQFGGVAILTSTLAVFFWPSKNPRAANNKFVI